MSARLSCAVRCGAAGVAASVIALSANVGLLIAYGNLADYARVEYVDSNLSRRHLYAATVLLLGLWLVMPLFTSRILAKLLNARLLVVCGVTAMLLFVPALYGVRLLSHLNECEGLYSFPLAGYATFGGHECGR